jgi:hypothetical protein
MNVSTADQMERLRRWRLLLGRSAQDSLGGMGACELGRDDVLMDEALAAIYDESEDGAGAKREAGLGGSAPRLAKWLGDIRTYFQEDVVAVIQNDAVERKGMKQLLLEPELLKNMQPSLALVGTLLSLSRQIPEHTKETAREVVRALVEQIRHLLESELRRAVSGALNRRQHSPLARVDSIDWKRTIARNLKNWQPELQRLVPERFWFWSRAQRQNQWTVIVDMDQSGSMADSVVYGAVTGSIFASLFLRTWRAIIWIIIRIAKIIFWPRKNCSRIFRLFYQSQMRMILTLLDCLQHLSLDKVRPIIIKTELSGLKDRQLMSKPYRL